MALYTDEEVGLAPKAPAIFTDAQVGLAPEEPAAAPVESAPAAPPIFDLSVRTPQFMEQAKQAAEAELPTARESLTPPGLVGLGSQVAGMEAPAIPNLTKLPETKFEKFITKASPVYRLVDMAFGQGTSSQLLRSSINNLVGLADFMSSPVGAITTAAGGLAPTALSAAFALDMGWSTSEAAKQLRRDWPKMNRLERTEALSGLVTNGLMTILPTAHVVKSAYDKVAPMMPDYELRKMGFDSDSRKMIKDAIASRQKYPFGEPEFPDILPPPSAKPPVIPPAPPAAPPVIFRPPPPAPVVPPVEPIEKGEIPNATQTRIEQERDLVEHRGVPSRPDLPAYPAEVRESPSEQAGNRGGDVGGGAVAPEAPKGEPEKLTEEKPWKGTITFESYDEPKGEWVLTTRPIVVSKTTIPGNKPWRATVFAGPKEDPVPVGDVQLDSPVITEAALGTLGEQLGRYTQKLTVVKEQPNGQEPPPPKSEAPAAPAAEQPPVESVREAGENRPPTPPEAPAQPVPPAEVRGSEKAVGAAGGNVDLFGKPESVTAEGKAAPQTAVWEPERVVAALQTRIGELHNFLIDSAAFANSEFYDGTYPIPRQGGIVVVRASERYQKDPRYADKVDSAIKDITDTMVAANRQRLALMDKPGTGAFGVDYSVEKVRATYGVNVVRAWHNEAKQKYPYTNRLGNVSVREAFQNALDAVIGAMERGEVRRGEIKIDVDSYNNKGFKVDDNGVGMSDVDIGTKFLSLHSTGKAVEGRFGGFGIAKAVILGPADSGTWKLTTRDNFFTHEMASNNDVVGTVPKRQGTEIEVRTEEYIIDDDAKRYVETTDLPKNVKVTFDEKDISNPFRRLKGETDTVVLNETTSYDLTYYPKPPPGYNQKYIIRLVDAKTGARLTQAIKEIGSDGFDGAIIVDITTKALPGTDAYPLVDSRMELKWGAEKPVSKLVEKKTVDPLTARRGRVEYRTEGTYTRPEWSETIRKTQSDPGYIAVVKAINDVWVKTGKFFGSAPDVPFTPLENLTIKIDTGYKGYHGGSMFQAKHLAAYEAVSRLMSFDAKAPVSRFYGILPKVVNGIGRNAEHGSGGEMGLNFLAVDKTALKDPGSYALYLRDLISHELTHEFVSPHNEEFSAQLGVIQKSTAHLFPDILKIAEAVLETEADFGKQVVEKRVEVPVEKIVEKRVEVPVEKPVFIDKYLTPQQKEFIYVNAERQASGSAKDELYYPRQSDAGQLRFESGQPSERAVGLGGKAEGITDRGGTEQPSSPSPVSPEPGGLVIGGIRDVSEPSAPTGAPIGSHVSRSGYTWEKRADGWYSIKPEPERKILPEREGWLEKQLTKPDKDVRVSVPKQAKVEAPKRDLVAIANEGDEVNGFRAVMFTPKAGGTPELRWYRVLEDKTLSKFPATARQTVELNQTVKQPPKPPAPVDTRTFTEILGKARFVTVDPKWIEDTGATFIRGYDARGRFAQIPVGDFNKASFENPLRNSDLVRFEAGKMGTKGWEPIKGDIIVKERKPKEMALPRQSEEGALAAIDRNGDEYEREVAAKWRSLSEEAKQAVRDFILYEESMEQKYGRLEWGRGSGTWKTGKDAAKSAIRRRENAVERRVNAEVSGFGDTAITFARGKRDPNMSGRFVNFWERRDIESATADVVGEPDRLIAEAKGPQDFLKLLERPDLQLPDREKVLFREFFRRPTIQKLDGLRLAIVEAIKSGFVGDFDPQSRLARFTDAQSGIHETLHDLWYYARPEDRMEYTQLRLREIAAALKDLPRIPKEIAALERLAKEPMSSEEFIRENMPRGLYYLANEREFFVASNESRFLREVLTPEAKGLVAKTKAIIQEVWNWLKTKVGIGDRRDALYRKILKGDYELSPEEGARLDAKEIEGALPRTPEEYKKQKAFDEKNVAGRTLAAYADIAKFKMEQADLLGLSPAARRMIQLPREAEMYAMAASELRGIENYYQARDAAPAESPHLRWGVIGDALHSLAYEEELARKLNDRYLKQQALVDSDSFQKKIAREAELAMRENVATAKEDTFRNVITQKIAVLEAQLRESGPESARAATLREDLRLARGLQEYAMAIGQQMDNIVNRVYPEFTRFGRAGYWTRFRENATGPKNGDEFLRLYQSARRAEGNPLENAQELALARLAAEILGINYDLTNRLLWAERWRREPDFQQAVKDLGATFVKRLREDPAAAIRWMVTREGKLATKAEQAKEAYLAINRDVMRELERLGDLEQAASAMKRIRESDPWKQLVNTVYGDADALHVPDVVTKAIKDGKYESMFNEFTGRMVKVGPKGNWHEIDLEWTPENALKSQEKLDKYLGEVDDWLNDPANEKSPDYQYWQEQKDWLYATYKTASVFAPRNVKSLLIHTALRMPEFWFKQAKLPAAKVAQTAAENWERSFDSGKQWSQGVEQPIIRLAQVAARKHGVDVSLGLQAYRELIFNSLAWAYRHGIAVKPGDKLYGVTVLTEDVNLLRAMGKAVNDLITRQKNLGRERVMEPERLVDDYFKNAFLIRRPQEFGAEKGTTVPREFSSKAKMLARRIVGETIAPDGTRIVKPLPLDRAMEVFNWESYFEPFVMRWLAERSADYSKVTPFEGLFKEVVKLHNEKSPDAPRSVEEIIDYIDRNTDEATTRDAIKEAVVGGMVGELTSFYNKFLKDDGAKALTIRVLRATSQGPFNKAFEHDIGSSFYYDYGMMSGQEVRSMALDAGMYHLERFEIALHDLERVYNKAMLEFDETKGNPTARAALKARNKELFTSGDDFRDFSVLRDQRAELRYFLENLPIWSGRGVAQYEGMQTMYRLVGDSVLSTLAGWKTLARVLSGSVVKQGFVFGAFERFYYTAYLKAALNMAMSAFQIGVKGPAMFAARRLGLAPKLDKEFSGWAEEIFRNGKYFDQQYAYGLGTKTPVLDTVYNNLVMPYTHGRGYDPRLSGNAGLRLLQEGGYKALAAFEAPLEVIKTIFPTLGYSIAYDSVARQMYWSIKTLEAQARRSFEAHERAGTLGRFDLKDPRNPKNLLPAEEILPRGIFKRTQTQLDLVGEYFKRGTDADINDFVMEFWKKLSETPKEQRGNIHLLSADAKTPEEAKVLEQNRAGALAAIGLFDIHHASPMNRMWALRASTVGRLAFPIAGWTLQSTRQWFALFGQSAHDPQMRKNLLTAMTAITVLAGMSAMAVGGDAEKRMFEKLEWIINRKVDPVRHFGQGRNTKENILIALHDVIAYITVLANLFDQVLGEKGNRSSAVDQIYVYAKLKSLAQYVSGVIHSKDPNYGLSSFVVREVPSLKPLLNRLPSNEGIVNLSNIRTAIQRYAPEELLRKEQGGYGLPTATELSPIKQRLQNAIYKNDSEGVAVEYENLKRKAVEVGRTEPLRLAADIMRSLNPYTLALVGHPTDAQRQELLSKLSEHERQVVLDGESMYLAAAQLVGVQSQMTRERRGVGGTGATAGYTPSLGASGAGSAVAVGTASSTGGGGYGGGSLLRLGGGGIGTPRRISLGAGTRRIGFRRGLGISGVSSRIRSAAPKAARKRYVAGRIKARLGRVGKRRAGLRSIVAAMPKRRISLHT